MKRAIIMMLLSLLAWPSIGLAEPARMIRVDNLYEKPFVDARVLIRLPVGQSVDIQKRAGGWYQVKAAGKLGWARLLSVRRTTPAAVVSAGSLGQIATGRSGSGQIVTTTGVRGLGEEELAAAPFNEVAVTTAERFRVSPAEAARLAGESGLTPREIPPLPVPTAGTRQGGTP